MTCVVAVASRKRVFMGADSLISDDNRAWRTGSPKVWVAGAGKYTIGFCGCLQWGNVLRHHVRWPTKTDELTKRLAECLQRACDRANYKLDGSQDNALIGHRGLIYSVDSYLTLMLEARDYAAIGQADVANGALFATRRWTPQKRVLAALGAAAEHTTGVREPFVIVSV